MVSTTIPRRAADRSMGTLQFSFAAIVTSVAALPFAVRSLEVTRPLIHTWLPAVVVLAAGVFSTFAVFYQRIRPVAPGSISEYRHVVAKRLGYALLPAFFGTVLFIATGHWTAVFFGAVLAMPGLFFSLPNQEDFIRHQEIWNERLPMPARSVWGTAGPDTIPPWEDPDGGHGHGIGHHGLH